MIATKQSLSYDGEVNIAVGESRRSVKWQNRALLWSELVARLEQVTRTPETQSEYFGMAKAKRDEIKDIGGFVGGTLKGGRRKAEAIVQRRLLTLDIDSVPMGEDPWPVVELVIGCAAVIYSTHSHERKAQRLRLVIPLSRPVTPDEYIAVARRVAGDIGIDMCDDTTYEPQRLMYWPSTSLDGEFRFEASDAQWLDVDEQLQRYIDWRDPSEWPVSSRKGDIMKRLAQKQKNPMEKSGVVGAFCRVYSVEDAIETFLPETYLKCDDERYTYAGGSTVGGLVLYENGIFAYSHHGTDPAGGKLCNAFDLVRLHLFSDQDDEVIPGTPVNKLPSFNSMSDLAIEDSKIREELANTRLREVSASFDNDEDTDWMSGFTMTARGKIESTIDNALLIMIHDPALRGQYHYDEFRERPVVGGNLPWQDMKDRTTDCWSDSDDAGLRRYLEKIYDIDSAVKIRDAVELAMLQNKRHPVREYLRGLTWDGVKRADAIFVDYLDAADTVYTREVTRKSLLGAVARIMKPGCKHDHILVLVGPQGCRKSTTIAKLGKAWFSDSLFTLTGKEAYEQLQGCWIIEMGEMAATRKAELEQIKHFTSKQSDSFRAAYARRTQDHPRQCAFFGSTNDDEFLKDPTGGRRFWPVVVTARGCELADAFTEDLVDQVWAEIVVRYDAGEKWHLSSEVEAMACEVQAAHTEMNGKLGLIENFLNILLPEDWENRDLENRLMFFNGGFGTEEQGTVLRDRVCAVEIWRELFGGDPKAYTQVQAREISGILQQIPGWKKSPSCECGKLYGRQRAFARTIFNT